MESINPGVEPHTDVWIHFVIVRGWMSVVYLTREPYFLSALLDSLLPRVL